MKRIYCLIKIFKEEDEIHANSFLQKGEMYCQTLKKFQEIEDGNLRGDKHESVSHWFQPDDIVLKISINHDLEGIPKELTISKNDLAGPVFIKTTEYDFHNIFCMYSIAVDDFEYEYTTEEDRLALADKIQEQLNNAIKIDENLSELGNFAVIITNVEEFISRIKKYAEAYRYKNYHGLVGYYNENYYNGSFDGPEAIFRKRDQYDWQKEYRFVFDINNIQMENKILEIGSLKDIGFITTVDQLKDMFKIKIDNI
jgi:hypothetical protein